MGGSDSRPARAERIPLAMTERRRPAVDERLFLAVPPLHRLGAALAFALRPGSRLRRHLLARNAQLSYEGQNRGDFRMTLALYAPDAELRNVPIAGGGQQVAGVQYSYRGRDGARRLLEDWLEPWESARFVPHELYDLGDGRLLILSEIVARGGRSGIEVRQQLAQLLRFRAGLVVGHDNWLGSWDDGLRAADLN